MTTVDNVLPPADPVPENQVSEIAGPLVAQFVDWLRQQGIVGTYDAHQIEHLYYEFAFAKGQPLLQKPVLFQHLAAHGIVRNRIPRELNPDEWRYKRAIRLGKQRPRVCTYDIDFGSARSVMATSRGQ